MYAVAEAVVVAPGAISFGIKALFGDVSESQSERAPGLF